MPKKFELFSTLKNTLAFITTKSIVTYICLHVREHIEKYFQYLSNYVRTSISSRVFGAYSTTGIFYKYAHLPTLSLFFTFSLTGPTHYTVWLPERILSLSQFQLTESTHSSSFLNLISTTNHHENVYYMRTFSSSLHFVRETFSSLENRNFVKPQKETNSRNT